MSIHPYWYTQPESQIAVESKFSASGSVHPYVKLPPEAILICVTLHPPAAPSWVQLLSATQWTQWSDDDVAVNVKGLFPSVIKVPPDPGNPVPPS